MLQIISLCGKSLILKFSLTSAWFLKFLMFLIDLLKKCRKYFNKTQIGTKHFLRLKQLLDQFQHPFAQRLH